MEVRKKSWSENLEERFHLKTPDINRRIILKWILRDLESFEYRSVVSSCDKEN
jgi:hypothetical protein